MRKQSLTSLFGILHVSRKAFVSKASFHQLTSRNRYQYSKAIRYQSFQQIPNVDWLNISRLVHRDNGSVVGQDDRISEEGTGAV